MQVHGIRGVGQCRRNWLRLYQTIKNLTDSTGSTGLKKIRLVYLLHLFEGKGEKGQCDLVCVEYLWMIGLMVVMLISYSHVVSVVLVHSGVALF